MISSSRQESIGDSEDEAIGGYTEPFFDSPVFDESSPLRPFLTPPTTTNSYCSPLSTHSELFRRRYPVSKSHERLRSLGLRCT